MDVFHEGFQLIRLSSDQPFITLSDKLLTFSKSSIEMLDYSPYVHISVNKEKKELLVEACKQDRFSVSFVKGAPDHGSMGKPGPPGSHKGTCGSTKEY